MSDPGCEDELPTVRSLDELAELVGGRDDLYLRWSRGPGTDIGATTRDELTGIELPGLSANPLSVEEWWEDRPMRVWVARRLYDYRHLREEKGPDVRPWVLEGREIGRGPDNEPVVRCERPLAWVDDAVVGEAVEEIRRQAGRWGPLRRPDVD